MALSATRVRRITFVGRKVLGVTRNALAKARKQVAKEIQADIRKKISKPFPPASTPGSHPHSRRASGLKVNVFVKNEGRDIVVRVPQYGIWLEGGTSRMRARPFIARNVFQKRWAKRLTNLARKFNTKK